jgi:hypothetical protein
MRVAKIRFHLSAASRGKTWVEVIFLFQSIYLNLCNYVLSATVSEIVSHYFYDPCCFEMIIIVD